MIPLSQVLRKRKVGYTYANKTKVNHLLFMDDLKLYARTESQLDSLIQSVRIFSNDIGMKFAIVKCAVLVLKRGKLAQTEVVKISKYTAQKNTSTPPPPPISIVDICNHDRVPSNK